MVEGFIGFVAGTLTGWFARKYLKKKKRLRVKLSEGKGKTIPLHLQPNIYTSNTARVVRRSDEVLAAEEEKKLRGSR